MSKLLECPECSTDIHLRDHCEKVACGWKVCRKCSTTLDVKSGRFNTPKKG